MSGKLLGELKELNVPDEAPSNPSQNSIKKSLTCPHCSAQMQKVNYNDTGIIIDSCTNCPYRWLDAGEVEKIEEYKPNIHPQDLLLLVSLQEKTRSLSNNTAKRDDPNPEVPLFSGGWGGIIRGDMAGGDRNTLGWLLGAGMYSLIVGIRKSKLARFLAPLIILGFIVLGYLLLKQLDAILSSRF